MSDELRDSLPLPINTTDSTYSSGGYVGMRIYSGQPVPPPTNETPYEFMLRMTGVAWEELRPTNGNPEITWDDVSRHPELAALMTKALQNSSHVPPLSLSDMSKTKLKEEVIPLPSEDEPIVITVGKYLIIHNEIPYQLIGITDRVARIREITSEYARLLIIRHPSLAMRTATFGELKKSGNLQSLYFKELDPNELI